MMSKTKGRLLLHWPRYGPYHRARLRAAVDFFEAQNVEVSGLEIASSDTIYAWQPGETIALPIHTLFPGAVYEELPWRTLWVELNHYLKQVRPDVIAINGYGSKSALQILLWCKLHRCKAILMSESKFNDAKRTRLVEWLKSRIVRQYTAFLCGGQLHKEYLVGLGANPQRIFLGYDAVDNEFFREGAQTARQHPEQFAHLPGLSDPRPFFLASSRFIPRKNLLGLLQAYQLYRRELAGDSPWRLVLLGDGPERNNLETFIHQHHLQDWVTLPGFRQIEELPAYYGLARAFIHPPLQEQWGLVVNEAMAAGLPVLVSEVCGCTPELVEDGANGFVFAPQDTVRLANLMSGISNSKYDIYAMSARSLEIISAWDTKRFARGLYQATEMAMQ